jgi:hypothetical protein
MVVGDEAVGIAVPTEVGMHPGRGVMSVVVVVVQVRVHQRRSQRRQLQSDG